ncbi:KPN_02809 family neutral zinc metallopeptidase [Actinocatenispora rupis]|uniref:Neutral zinc metallopeptidase n=1 Tax=Actinocatenispora rupis TaxID=519421 RepID=A0A8J3JBR6_9ACTN|nr:neutral zinc metallopeptidase [Actinocatenispora rupis]GID15466.1 neutral zinc metallopeptidase [Actinocatenispora rupis]
MPPPDPHPPRTARHPTRAVAVLALLVLLAVAACSNGSGSGDHASPRPSPTASGAPHLAAAPEPSAAPTFPQASTDAGRRELLTDVFHDAQAMWTQIFANSDLTYHDATLTFFTTGVDTGCGPASSDTGPFYCPADRGVYLDLSFFTVLQQKFGVQGGLPPAYVVGHEMGHHVQNLLGTLARVRAAQQAHPSESNALSVRLELQADCYAGVWIHATYARDLVSRSDLDDALHAATVIADDFRQHVTTGKVRPDEWTHGSAAQRRQWLTTGFTSGRPDDCDTFAGTGL